MCSKQMNGTGAGLCHDPALRRTALIQAAVVDVIECSERHLAITQAVCCRCRAVSLTLWNVSYAQHPRPSVSSASLASALASRNFATTSKPIPVCFLLSSLILCCLSAYF